MRALVGHTGFVGSNLYASGAFDKAFNSKNIKDSYGLRPDLLVFAGLRAEKYLANQNPENDLNMVHTAEEIIERINPKRLVLISTIDVFNEPIDVNENSPIDTARLRPYGLHRYGLENWVRDNYADHTIIRLPGLFGKNIKKNFIYDLIHVIPYKIRPEKFKQLAEMEDCLPDFYALQSDGFYQCSNLNPAERALLRDKFNKLGFTAVNFTDSRSIFQFYPLERLWNDMQILLDREIRLWHAATEPLSAGELYRHYAGKEFHNQLSGTPSNYDCRTIYSDLFHGGNGYICQKNELITKIINFMRTYQHD